MILKLLHEAVAGGARLWRACEVVGLTVRTVQRWRRGPGEDMRCGPRTEPANKLSQAEQQELLTVVNSPTYRDLSPKQIVPKLADEGRYLASESTIYRMLRKEGQLTHREPSAAPCFRLPTEHVATGPNQVWSWDITYLRSPVAGRFFYLYLVLDVWSRKIVGAAVHEEESGELAAKLITKACAAEGVDEAGLVVHADNGGPMKGATMLVTLERLGVVPSFSRPRVSDDNPFSESIFRTLKYRPTYPRGPFASAEAARAWVADFVRWYNTEHQHSAIRFVTPEDRHTGREAEILAERRRVYETARRRRPERWSGTTRNWTPVPEVRLNPHDRTPTDVQNQAA